MKKIYIALAVVATAMLVSCEREKDFGGLTPLGENDIAFTINNTGGTRSMEAVSETAVQTGVSIPAGRTSDGEAFYLEETIEELNPTLATRGTPAYTVNLGKVYTTMGVYADGNFGEANFEVMDYYDRQEASEGMGWRYHHNYNGSPWPEDKTTPVDFYLNMPAAPEGVTMKKRENQKIEFEFVSQYKGEKQQDILFAHTQLSKKQHDGYLPNGAPVTMLHALTGVKFRTGHLNNNSTHTIITNVTIKGLKDKGYCIISPDEGKVEWPADQLEMVLGTFSQEFENPTYTYTTETITDDDGNEQTVYTATSNDGTIGLTGDDDDHKWNADLAGTSWADAAADKNLNDKDGSLTFWFIPQTVPATAQLEVTFYVKTPDSVEGTKVVHTIEDFGAKLNNVEWKAGQLRTYTLKPFDVDVEIKDDMSGMKKENLHVANTGNVDEYVRMLIVGNWYGWKSQTSMDDGDEPSILVGYKTNGSGGEDDNELVDYWDYRDESKMDGSYFDDTFKYGKPANGNKWVRGTGAYYYPYAIGAGEKLPSGTDALFKSYEYTGTVPDIYIPSITSNIRDKAVGVHLVMEVVVQAIPTTRADGSEYESIWQAWSETTGTTIGPK